MDNYQEKLANFFGHAAGILGASGGGIGRGLALGAGFVAIGAVADLVNKIVTDQYHIYKSKTYYEEMLKQHPQLKQFPATEIAKYFNSLNHFAPSVAKDPLAAGAYLTQSLKKLSGEELGGPPPDTFNTLADIEKKISDSKGSNSVDRANKIYSDIASSAVKGVMSVS